MAGQIDFIFTKEFKKSYLELPANIQKKVKKQLKFFEADPKHPSLKIHRLNDDWEFYVDIHYRCFFQREGDKIYFLAIGTHKIVDQYKRR